MTETERKEMLAWLQSQWVLAQKIGHPTFSILAEMRKLSERQGAEQNRRSTLEGATK
jgi:hypothetical protein